MKRIILSLLLMAYHSSALSQCLSPDIQLTELSDDLPGQTFSAQMQVSAEPGAVMQVLQDMESYPDYMTDVSEVKIISRVDNKGGNAWHSKLVVEERLALPLGKVKAYRLQISVSDNRLDWQQLPWPELPESQGIADTSGWWSVSALNDACSAVEYHVYTDPGKVPFGLGWIVDRMTQSSIPGLLQAVRERVENQ